MDHWSVGASQFGTSRYWPGEPRLEVTADGFDLTDQYPAAHLTSDAAQGPISAGFDSLSAMDVWTDEGEGYLRVEWLNGSATTQRVLAEIPDKDGDVVVGDGAAAAGLARPLAWREE